MRFVRDMASFDDNPPVVVKFVGRALGFTLRIATHVTRLKSALILSASDHEHESRHRSTSLDHHPSDRFPKVISESKGRTPLPNLLPAGGEKEPEVVGFRKLILAITLNRRK
jgi:hypothetical protein